MRLASLMTVLAFLSRPALSQACLGLPNVAHHTRITGSASFADSSKAFGAAFGGGLSHGLFGDVGVSRVTYDNVSGGTNGAFAEGGIRLPFPALPFELCPVAGLGFGTGPKNIGGPGTDVSYRSATGGIAVGVPIGWTGLIELIPNATVAWSYTSQKNTVQDGSSTSTSHEDAIDLGLALLLFDRLSVQPTYQIPFSSDYGDKTWGVFVGVSLRR